MKPQPPVTKMRIASPTSSSRGTALVDSPASLMEWRWTPWLIVALGAVLRILFLEIKPPHFDEGINGWFVDQMIKTGFYRYDPTNYHGPLHFYILFLSQTLFGRNIWALRMPVVLASIFCIRLCFNFEAIFGRNTCRWAALAMAVSPGFVFYGRYSIHEVWLVLFSMLFILGLLGLWKFGTRGYLWCVGMGIAGMILTKETYVIHIGCVVAALPIAWISDQLTPAKDARPVSQSWKLNDLILITGVAVAAIIFFYSGAFMNWNGVKGLFQTFDAWFKTGHNGNGHEKPWSYWMQLIGRYEQPVAVGLIACLFCQLFKDITIRFLAIYGVGVLAAYSIVHYKTPWCVISVVWPLLFLFGAGLSLIPKNFVRTSHILAGLLLLVSLGLSVRLNYFRCTTDTEPYVYVQTYNDIFKLTKPLLKLARRDPTKYQLIGHIIRTSAYPLPWILGDFSRIGYYEKDALPSPMDADFLLVQADKIEAVEGKLENAYYTAPLTIRSYQDTSKLYLSAKVFKDFFPGQTPEFSGKGADR